MPSDPIAVADYLFQRLYQLGVRAVHGVPGDYNLEALDHLGPAGLTWVGNANELNAGYAADGYARVKGLGAVLTTFGVGELSALNAVAGSFAEYVPVVHIVGFPPAIAVRDQLVLHHSLGNGDYQVFGRMAREVSVAHTYLRDPALVPSQIDQVLRQCILRSQPVCIQLPTDMVHKVVDARPLATPINLSNPPNDVELEKQVVLTLVKKIEDAQRPCILVDGCVRRHGMLAEVDAFVRKSGLPTFVAPMGKSIINETYPNFSGVYAGDGSNQDVKAFVESSDLVLCFGTIKSDFNTSGFTVRISALRKVEFHVDFTEIDGKAIEIQLPELVNKVTEAINPKTLLAKPKSTFSNEKSGTADLTDQYAPSAITHEYLWPKLSEWLQPNDIILTETGTAYLGIWDTTLPRGVHLISQTLWGSIGYTLPAAQGAALAVKEIENQKQRVILFEGDGSFHLTAQSISTMLHHNLDIIIFLINNEGYTIERWVHGMEAAYNDIPTWHYAEIPRVFGGTTTNSKSYCVDTVEELEALWRDDSFINSKGMRFVEMKMPKTDAPHALKLICSSAAKTNTAG